MQDASEYLCTLPGGPGAGQDPSGLLASPVDVAGLKRLAALWVNKRAWARLPGARVWRDEAPPQKGAASPQKAAEGPPKGAASPPKKGVAVVKKK